MPDTIQDTYQSSDTTSFADGIGTLDATDFHSDLVFVGAQGLQCETFEPGELGLSQEVSDRVAYVLKGPDCKPIYVHPDLQEEGCDLPAVVPVDSNIKFDGTMFVLANENGFDLQEGQLLYKAFRDACDKYPEAAVKAIGIELKPEAKNSTVMQARVEPSDLGELLLRVHIWQGNGRILSIDGQTFLDLVAGEQVLIDTHLNILQAFSVEPPNQSEEDPVFTVQDKDSFAPDNGISHTASTHAQNPGCNIPAGRPHAPDTLAPLFALVAALWIGRSIRQLKGGAGSRGLIKAISQYLASGEKKK